MSVVAGGWRRWIRVSWGMLVRPHENMSVWSVRHDPIWHDRHSSISARYLRADRVHELAHHAPTHVTVEPKATRFSDRVDVVTRTDPARPADCHPCDRGTLPESGEYVPYMPDVWKTEAPQSDAPTMVRIYFDKTGLSQGFTHGQLVPAAGSLLDIFA